MPAGWPKTFLNSFKGLPGEKGRKRGSKNNHKSNINFRGIEVREIKKKEYYKKMKSLIILYLYLLYDSVY